MHSTRDKISKRKVEKSFLVCLFLSSFSLLYHKHAFFFRYKGLEGRYRASLKGKQCELYDIQMREFSKAMTLEPIGVVSFRRWRTSMHNIGRVYMQSDKRHQRGIVVFLYTHTQQDGIHNIERDRTLRSKDNRAECGERIESKRSEYEERRRKVYIERQ